MPRPGPCRRWGLAATAALRGAPGASPGETTAPMGSLSPLPRKPGLRLDSQHVERFVGSASVHGPLSLSAIGGGLGAEQGLRGVSNLSGGGRSSAGRAPFDPVLLGLQLRVADIVNADSLTQLSGTLK